MDDLPCGVALRVGQKSQEGTVGIIEERHLVRFHISVEAWPQAQEEEEENLSVGLAIGEEINKVVDGAVGFAEEVELELLICQVGKEPTRGREGEQRAERIRRCTVSIQVLDVLVKRMRELPSTMPNRRVCSSWKEQEEQCVCVSVKVSHIKARTSGETRRALRFASD